MRRLPCAEGRDSTAKNAKNKGECRVKGVWLPLRVVWRIHTAGYAALKQLRRVMSACGDTLVLLAVVRYSHKRPSMYTDTSMTAMIRVIYARALRKAWETQAENFLQPASLLCLFTVFFGEREWVTIAAYEWGSAPIYRTNSQFTAHNLPTRGARRALAFGEGRAARNGPSEGPPWRR